MDMSRRQFFRVSGAGLVGSSIAALGFSPAAALAETRNFKLARTTETRNTCPYCSVGCGLIMYSLGDRAKNVVPAILHIEGDPDHPVNRGTLCPKGAGLLDFVHSPHRLKFPEVREAGSNEWKRISWDSAVNRWTSTGMLCASASSNETGYITHKAFRSLGMLVFDNQARV